MQHLFSDVYEWTFTLCTETSRNGNEGICVGLSLRDNDNFAHRLINLISRT